MSRKSVVGRSLSRLRHTILRLRGNARKNLYIYIRSIIIRLVVDEALFVGDRKFAKKCRERVNSIIANENVTVLFVTHSTGTAKEFCHRGIVIQKGKAMFSGGIEEAVDFYTAS